MLSIKDLVAYITKALVVKPEEVVVIEIDGLQTSVIELKVAKEDSGKVIGRRGRAAEAMGTILNGACAKLKKQCVREIIE